MRYATVCSGIEAPSVAWAPLGWQRVFFSEIEKFPCRLLAERFPSIPNYGDMRNFKDWPVHEEIDLIIGGTPCQSFSMSGDRGGVDDPRGNLTLTYIELVAKYRPRWLIWENVPGVLSSKGGRDFSAFVGALARSGYHAAWRVLDAQDFGLPQMRRRLYLVGYFGDWRPAAKVLFEFNSMPDAIALGGEAPKADAAFFKEVAHGRFYRRLGLGYYKNSEVSSICMATANSADKSDIISADGRLRRLTPLEYERLMGFPDNWTALPGASDTQRYKACGNSMAVNVVRWIGRRIEGVEK